METMFSSWVVVDPSPRTNVFSQRLSFVSSHWRSKVQGQAINRRNSAFRFLFDCPGGENHVQCISSNVEVDKARQSNQPLQQVFGQGNILQGCIPFYISRSLCVCIVLHDVSLQTVSSPYSNVFGLEPSYPSEFALLHIAGCLCL